MPTTPLSYVPSQQSRRDLSYGGADWQTALAQYDRGLYLDAFCSTLNYMRRSLGDDFKKDPEAGVTVAHGSVEVFITLHDYGLRLLAPLVNIAGAQKIAVLRRVCELNFSTLDLATIQCKDDKLSLVFRCPLEGCEPYKMHDVLREICWTADKYDDEFLVFHNAQLIYPAQVGFFSEARKTAAWQGFKQYLKEGREWTAYWQSAGYNYLAWDVAYLTLLKIDHLCAPQGFLKSELEDCIDRLLEKKDIHELVNVGANALRALDNLPEQTFCNQLYDAETLVPAKILALADRIQTALKPWLQDAYDFLLKKDYVNTYLCLQKSIFKLLYNYRFHEQQWQRLEAMLTAPQPSLADAANNLYNALHRFYTAPEEITVPAPQPEKATAQTATNWFN